MAAEVYLTTKITDAVVNTSFDTKRLIGRTTKITDAVVNTPFDTKRLIGRKVADPIVQADCKLLPFKVISGPGVSP